MDLPLDMERGIVSTTTLVPHNGSTATLVDEIEADLGAFTPTTEVDEIVFSVAPVSLEKKDDDLKKDLKDNSIEQEKQRRPCTPATLPPLDPITPFVAPDGGATAWCQVAAGFLLNAIAWGTSMMFGIYQLYYTQTLGLNNSAVSWVGSVQTFLTYLFSTVSGLLADAGYSRHVTAAGTVFVVAGGLGTSFSAPAPPADISLVSGAVPSALFLSQAVIMGIGLGLLTAPALPSINAYFDKRRSLALAVSTMGTSFGGALLPVVVQFLLPAIGFGWAVRCATLLALVICVNASLLLRQPPASAATLTTTSTPVEAPKRSIGARVASVAVDWSAMRELPFVLFLASTFLLYWGLYFGFYYINTYAQDVVGFSTNRSTTLLILSTALGMPSRAVSGAFADAYAGALDTLIISTLCLGGAIFGWIGVGASTPGMYVFVVLFGLCNGAVQSVWIGSIAELSKHAASRIGARFGMVCVVAAVATLAGAPTASALISVTNGGNTALASTYRTAQIWGAATTMASAGVLVVARVYTVGWHLKRV
ncbi:hypothetical protein SEUCBS139899_009761 [Sporothrix eucalyptigena]|uniref:Major facilitator superfamily transporter monocarboxylate n=1 Tax=Sporothrix eucalyptigena TaxID=1812306 RepID=A0ABP0CW60_9PEZI